MLKWFKKKEEQWWEKYEKKSLLTKLHEKFQDFISYLIHDRNWNWLNLLICTLCDLEMYIPLLFDEEFKGMIDYADTVYVSLGQEKSYADEEIPKDTFYCEGCIYSERSKIARFFFGQQSSGYCYYLGKGDYSFLKPTMILWDGCKECGRFEDVPEEELCISNDPYDMTLEECWEKADEENRN